MSMLQISNWTPGARGFLPGFSRCGTRMAWVSNFYIVSTVHIVHIVHSVYLVHKDDFLLRAIPALSQKRIAVFIVQV
jgi:hypothetical protein